MTMRRGTLFALCVVAMLGAMAIPVSAGPPTQAGGEWTYITALAGPPRVAGCNVFVEITETDTFTGTFSGVSNGQLGRSTVVEHCSGSFSYRATIVFEEVEVDGRTGGMVMKVNGRLAAGETDWTGTWRILSASGELEGLKGQGSWWGPGAGGPGLPGFLEYDGNVHFRPQR